MGCRSQCTPKEKKGNAHHIKLQTISSTSRQRHRHVRAFHIAKPHSYTRKGICKPLQRDPVGLRDPWHVSVTTFRMTLLSCKTLLCLMLCSKAVGVASGWPVRKTAVAANVAAEGCDVTKKTGERCSKNSQNPDLQNSGLLNRSGSHKGCTGSGFSMTPMPTTTCRVSAAPRQRVSAGLQPRR